MIASFVATIFAAIQWNEPQNKRILSELFPLGVNSMREFEALRQLSVEVRKCRTGDYGLTMSWKLVINMFFSTMAMASSAAAVRFGSGNAGLRHWEVDLSFWISGMAMYSLGDLLRPGNKD